MQKLNRIVLKNYTTQSGVLYDEILLTYQLFGKPLGTAPIVMINHALTGNSNVAGENGWWNTIVGVDKTINLETFTVLSFNIVGNGYDGFLIENYHDFVAKDIALLFIEGLQELNIKKLFALVGGSLGGGIAWEMLAILPNLTTHLVVVATDWKATDWLIANCQIQEQILKNSKEPVHDARLHAMLCYRTPASLKKRFNRTLNETLNIFNVESWLLHHGKKLQERFQLSAYKLMNQLLKTIDVTKGRNFNIFEAIKANIHIVGVDSDLFFTAEENRETYQFLAQQKANVTYHEINSVHGHDAFLIEYEQLDQILNPIFNSKHKSSMKVIKFGGKSLANGEGIKQVIQIIEDKVQHDETLTIVVSARGNTTDILEELLEKAKQGLPYQEEFEALKTYQNNPITLDFSEEFSRLQTLFDGVSLLNDYSLKIKDEVLAFGELLSAKTVSQLLNTKQIPAEFLDARKIIKTDANFGNAQVQLSESKEKTVQYFKDRGHKIQVVTGFIGATDTGITSTLGRNGSNYTASLLANFLNASEFQNYTHVDGVYTADPNLVEDAQIIKELSFNEANELANFGANILHAKTIVPLLEKNINLRILNTFNPLGKGTLITSKPESKKGIKSISVLKDVALLNFEGRGLLGKSGIDARIFGALGKANISVSIISQGSSERGIGFVVSKKDAINAVKILEQEFEQEFYTKDVNAIHVDDNVAVISMIGLDLSEFHLPYNALINNQIVPLLFNNTVTGKNVSLVVKKTQLNKALHVIHGQIFGVAKKINIAVFGVGLVGGTLINQILENKASVLQRRGVQLSIFAVANSKKVFFNKNGVSATWQSDLENGKLYSLNDVIDFANAHHLENLIAIDNTANKEFINHYIPLIENGFDLVSSNKVANTVSYDFYKTLRSKLETHNRNYLYETNVGAGLPLIDTIRLLHESGENITKIRGVFSGSLSYLFNTFSTDAVSFSQVLQQAIDKGFTEPDPREDLCGNDVARKLLILARELDLQNEFEDIKIENLIPENLRDGSAQSFLEKLHELNLPYQNIKDQQKQDHVLRYIGELSGDLFSTKGDLSVNLVSVSKDSPLGSLKGSDAIFEIFTESYGDQPIVIQGAGAGANVTARGVFGDILRLAKS